MPVLDNGLGSRKPRHDKIKKVAAIMSMCIDVVTHLGN